MRLKVLFISSWFPNRLEPTNGNFVQRHAEAVSKLHDVEVLHAIGDFGLKTKFEIENKEINNLKIKIVYYKNTKFPILNFLRRMKAYSIGYSQMEKPDIIHANILNTNLLFALWLKIKEQMPMVVSEHWSAYLPDALHPRNFLGRKLAQFIGNQSDYIFPVSEKLKKGLRKLGIKSPMKIIPNVVDTNTFTPIEHKNEIFTFLHISNLVPLKNIDKIIEAADILYKKRTDFQLHIGGDGSEEDLAKLRKLSEGKSYIKTFGWLTHQEVCKKMQYSNCFILFSTNEVQPCVITESLSCGVPVISSAVGAIPEIVDNESKGILVENNNISQLIQAMETMLNNTKHHNKQELHQYVYQTFSIESISKQFDKIYQDLVNKKC